MSINKIYQLFVAAILLCSATVTFTSCEDILGHWEKPTSDLLKQGIWTEYDEALLTSGKYTAEELAAMPTVGMKIEGDKGYFFTYTADDTSEPVEGQISYNKSTGRGSITFPAIAGSPLSGQYVSFKMTTDETMEFEFTYEGQKTTGTCAWLCENLDNWSSDITDEDWKELMAYYEQYDAYAGPDASIDWSDSEVEGLDKPLVWDDGIAATRAENSDADSKVKTPENIFSSIFKSDPIGDISDKLDDLLEKIDEVLANQRIMIQKLDEINERLIAIANKMNQQETVNIFNTRNSTYYNPLDAQNVQFFNSAFDLYNKNKSNLSQENKDKLGEYAKAWAGDGKMYVDLTWQYMKYITTVQHSTYGTGMDRIYDGLTYDKYPWEHMGTGDRLSYRSYDLTMIAKSLFMITLYATYGGLSDVEKEGLYNIYSDYTTKFLAFCDFKVTNPDKFLVCQIPGAHFAMDRELQEYKYFNGVGSDAPDPKRYGPDAIYMPRWHFRGKIKIDNPAELREKLIPRFKMNAILNYYGGSPWYDALIEGHQYSAGATCNDSPRNKNPKSTLLLWNNEKGAKNGAEEWVLVIAFTRFLDILNVAEDNKTYDVYRIESLNFADHPKWNSYTGPEVFYLAIVAWHL